MLRMAKGFICGMYITDAFSSNWIKGEHAEHPEYKVERMWHHEAG
ncbi:UNVERIFIED_CONTAM: hypothetical protein ABIC26_003446 [Paenibacillus sp. PvR008]